MLDPTCICATCGTSFIRPGRSGPLPRFCSQDCNPARRPRFQPCSFCGELFDRRKTKQRFCSTSCQNRAKRNRELPERNCIRCGERLDFMQVRPGGRRYKLDAVSCFDCRRDQRYELTVQQLADRDGTDCSLCGEPVDMTLKWPDRMAPTRDHVIPVTHGGSNTAGNLRLAHFSCNCRKGNRVKNAS